MKLLASNPEFGTLRTMFERLFEKFITEKPYRAKTFQWTQPAKVGTPGWGAQNITVNEDLAARLKKEAVRLEVSLTTLLYTALLWWIEQQAPKKP